MTYDQSIEYLASLEKRGWRLGLDRMEDFLRRAQLTDAVGSGERSPRYIHIGGTNGKGSVTAYAQSLAAAHGFRAGGYFSPYVYNVRERIQLDGMPISEEEFAQVAGELRPAADSMVESEFGGPTEFEFKTAMGFLAWSRARCEMVALEVGLGGRLDATNVVHAISSVIVSIGHDHMEILGPTLEAIAREKAGIVKHSVPLVLGEIRDDAARRAILERASELDATVWQFGKEIRILDRNDGWTVTTPAGTLTGLRPGMRSAVQPHNMALAIAALQVAGVALDVERVRDAVEKTVLPGRFQSVVSDGKRFLLDGAHNAEAAQNLRATLVESGLASTDHPAILITGMLYGHEPGDFFREFEGLVRSVHVCPIEFHRTRPETELAELLRIHFPAVLPHRSAREAIEAAKGESRADETILVTGSFYLVGEVGRLIGADRA